MRLFALSFVIAHELVVEGRGAVPPAVEDGAQKN